MRSAIARRWSLAVALAALGAALLLLVGGSFMARQARTAYDTAGLHVQRDGWDSLRVQPRFVRRTSLGTERLAHPGTTFVHVFGADYDTLYAGPGAGAIPVPDRRLASREPLLVEACGSFQRRNGASSGRASASGSPPGASHPARMLCEQTTVFASPKRVRVGASEIAFPEGRAFRRGRYDVQFIAERRAFRDSTVWEPLDASVPGGYLLARSRSAGGRGTVRVPMSASGRGTFDLARHDGYDDFRYHLRAAMERAEATGTETAPAEATVSFEVRAALAEAPPQPVHRTRRAVRRLTPSERRRQAQLFARNAAEEIVRRLMTEDEAEDVRATIQGWRYDRIQGRYEVDLRVRWFDRGDFDDRHTLEGTLTVRESDRQARFLGERGNRRAVRRWRRAVEGDELALGTLEKPPGGTELPEVEINRQRDLARRRSPSDARRSERHRHSHEQQRRP